VVTIIILKIKLGLPVMLISRKFSTRFYEAYPNVFYGKNQNNFLEKKDIKELLKIMKHRGKTVRYCLHEKITDLVHVSVIATNKAYPNNIHKHPHKIETIYALKGNANLCLYVNDQNDKEIQNLSSSNFSLIQIPKNTFHNFELISNNFVFIEISEGPFNSESTLYK